VSADVRQLAPQAINSGAKVAKSRNSPLIAAPSHSRRSDLSVVISVIPFKVLVIDVGCAAGSVHVWRVEDDAVNGGVLIWIVLDEAFVGADSPATSHN
jgi:hypothetical protein